MKVLITALALSAPAALAFSPGRSPPPRADAKQMNAAAASAFPGYTLEAAPSADPSQACFLTPEWIDDSGSSKNAWVCVPSHVPAADADGDDSY